MYADKGTDTEKQYYVTDPHGNVVQLTDEGGKVTKTYEYDSFGNEVKPDSKDENPFRYCGEYYDKEMGEVYLRARYYQPAVGRFLTRDSYTGQEDEPESLHLYTYCENDGVNAWDPSGHRPKPWTALSDFKSDWAGREILFHYLYGKGKTLTYNNDNKWSTYMKENKILKKKTRKIVKKLAQKVKKGRRKNIYKKTKMIIENGEQIIGYQYLHGTNSDAGGYLIRGFIDKSRGRMFGGKIVCALVFQWNDIIDPNYQYSSDKTKSEFAKKLPLADPKDYYIHISWGDVSTMNCSNRFLTGWLSSADSKENKFKFKRPLVLL